MFAPFKLLALALIVVFILLWSTGILAFDKRDYECAQERTRRLDRVTILDFDGFQLNAYPYQSYCANDVRIYYDDEGNYIPQSELTDEQLLVQ